MNILNSILRLSPYVRKLERLNYGLMSGELTLEQIWSEEGFLEIQACNRSVGLLASQMQELLDQSNPENYIQIDLTSPRIRERIHVIIQKSSGKSPHEIRLELEGKLKELEGKTPQ